MKVAIAGGGIGGLTAALALHRAGHEVVVCEQAPALREVGAGVQLSPNAMRVLIALDLGEAVEAAGFRPRGAQVRVGATGAVLSTSSYATYEADYGAPYVHIARADLLDALARAVAERTAGSVRLGQPVRGYGQDARAAWLQLDGDGRVEADAVVGADGIHSAIRTAMLGPQNPRFTGHVAWRAVVPVERLGRNAPLAVSGLWLGERRHAVTYLLRGGALANFVGVVERGDWQVESWMQEGERADAMADFAGWHPIVTTLIERADTLHRWALFDRDPFARWTDGRAALLGDAAHPMLPFMAQGAAQGIEDAWVLAHHLSSGRTVEDALGAYAAARQPRTARVQRLARDNAERFHRAPGPAHGAAARANRGLAKLKKRVRPPDPFKWLYSHDVTALQRR